MAENINIPDYIGEEKRIIISGWLEEIIDAFSQNRIQFLFGAGMSFEKNNGIPLGKDLSKIILKKFFPSSEKNKPSEETIEDIINKYPFEIIAEALSIKLANKRKGLSELLIDSIVNVRNLPPKAYQKFASIRDTFNWPKVIYTTNFDKFFEELFKDGAKPIHHNNVREYQSIIDKELIPIVYLHGTLESGVFQITEEDIYNMENPALMSNFKMALMISDVFVFIGYSLNDPDFKKAYRDYLNSIKDGGRMTDKTAFFVSPPNNIYEYLLGQKVWEARKANWIPYSAETFFASLNEIYDDNLIKKYKCQVGKIYKKNPEDTEKLIKEIANLLLITEEEAVQYLIKANK
jgi:hypothetical protein